jgi:adenylate cyclase
MDCIFSSFTTDRPSGFEDAELEIIDRIVPCLASAILGISLGRIADTLVETYLGRDAGRRVLRGSIERGVAGRIQAVLWFSDLKGFTRLVDTVSPELVIPMLNDYADAIASSIHDHGGQVLKLVGDGVLATFALEESPQACGGTLDCVTQALRRIEAVNDARTAKGLPTTGCYIALHVGDVFYGNIGSTDRLDFTVIGPAVNEASRIETLCRKLGHNLLISDAFAAAASSCAHRLVPVGRHVLRGVRELQMLYTIAVDG